MAKSREAFRTISEVADWLDTPAHVLRFWESKFSQIKPVKRAGGRRYYRPQDMALLGGIKTLLHDQGMTIKGAQKLLREQGVKHVSGLGPQLHDDDGEIVEEKASVAQVSPAAPVPSAPVKTEPDPDDPWPADPWPAEQVEASEPDVVAAPSQEAATADSTADRLVARLVPDLPDPISAEPTTGILSVVLAANPTEVHRNRAMITPLLDRLAGIAN